MSMNYILLPRLESWHFYGTIHDFSQFYNYAYSVDKETFEVVLYEYEAPCILRLLFKKNVYFYSINSEFSSVIRELEIDVLMQRDVYWEWPLFEVNNSPLIDTIMSYEEFEAMGLKHFVIFTQTFFIDIFAAYEPEIIVENKKHCSRGFHKKPKPLDEVLDKI